MRFSSVARGSGPEVAPEITTVPPCTSERSEWLHVAAPTVSITASTRSGSRAPDSKAWSAPSSSARARFASSRLVTHTRSPAAAPRRTRAVETPPPAPCTSTVPPGCSPGLGEEHAVGGQPRRRQAGGLLPGQARRLRHEVAPWDHHLVGEGALEPFGEKGTPRVHRLVAAEVGVAHHCMDDDLVAVVVDARGVAAQGHRQPVGGQAHAAQAPQVVVVEAGRPHVHPSPALGDLGLGAFVDLQGGQGVLRRLPGGVGSEHGATLPSRRRHARATPS